MKAFTICAIMGLCAAFSGCDFRDGPYKWEGVKLTGVPGDPVFEQKPMHPFLAEYEYRVRWTTNVVDLAPNTGGGTKINVYRLPAAGDRPEYVIFEEKYATSLVLPDSQVCRMLDGGANGENYTLSTWDPKAKDWGGACEDVDGWKIPENAVFLGSITDAAWTPGGKPLKLDEMRDTYRPLYQPPEDPNVPWPIRVKLAGFPGEPVFEKKPFGHFDDSRRRLVFDGGKRVIEFGRMYDSTKGAFNIWQVGDWFVCEGTCIFDLSAWRADKGTENYSLTGGVPDSRGVLKPLEIMRWEPVHGSSYRGISVEKIDPSVKAVYRGKFDGTSWSTNAPPLEIPQANEKPAFRRYRFPRPATSVR